MLFLKWNRVESLFEKMREFYYEWLSEKLGWNMTYEDIFIKT